MDRHSRKAYKTATYTSRHTYLLIRLGWGAIALGIIHFLFTTGENRWVAFDVVCVAAGILMIILGGRLSKKKIDPDTLDENGNAKKKVL